MALETGDYITDLVITNPVGATDSKSQGDDHLRLIKKTIKQTFPNMNGAVTVTPSDLNLLSGIAQHTITVGDFGLLANFNAANLLVKLNTSAQVPTALIPVILASENGIFTNHAGGNPLVAEDTFAPTTSVTENAWESVGPTGSGADNIWTALDALPSTIDWIEVKAALDGRSSGDTANALRILSLAVRENGSSRAVSSYNVVAKATDEIDGAGNGFSAPVCCGIKIPLASKVFDCYWSTTFNSSNSIDMVITGYGHNGS